MPGGVEGEEPTEGGAWAHPEAREGRGAGGGAAEMTREFSAGEAFGQTQGGSPLQGLGILDGGAMGHSDASFSNMSSLS